MRTRSTAPSIRTNAILAVFVAIVSTMMFSAAAPAAPEPNPVATRWEFTFENGPLRLVWIDSGEGERPFYYLTYQVTNFWGSDLLFAPDVQLVSDTGEVQRSGQDVPNSVTQQILTMLDNPHMESQIDIVSTVLDGPEHARDGVVIWPANDLDVDSISVYFGGLSGEFEAYIVGRETDDPHRYTLRKTRMLRYSTPGDFSKQGSRPLELIEERWVMR
jgi:hypothetical protein